MPSKKSNQKMSFKHLGHSTAKNDFNFTQPESKILEKFENQHPDSLYVVNLLCNEFTSLCPITGQPDWATITIRYVPNKLCVESKSLKLYLFSFRNHGEFHEDVINRMTKDLFALMNPHYLQIYGKFHARGGIAIHPFVEKWNKINPQAKAEIREILKNNPQMEAQF